MGRSVPGCGAFVKDREAPLGADILRHGRPDIGALPVRRFCPRISGSVSTLTPGYATQTMAGPAFIPKLQAALAGVEHEIAALPDAPWPLPDLVN